MTEFVSDSSLTTQLPDGQRIWLELRAGALNPHIAVIVCVDCPDHLLETMDEHAFAIKQVSFRVHVSVMGDNEDEPRDYVPLMCKHVDIASSVDAKVRDFELDIGGIARCPLSIPVTRLDIERDYSSEDWFDDWAEDKGYADKLRRSDLCHWYTEDGIQGTAASAPIVVTHQGHILHDSPRW